ncbi:glycosyltransferase [Streptomyces zhihengii]
MVGSAGTREGAPPGDRGGTAGRPPLVLAGPVGDRAYFEEQVAPGLGGDIVHAGHLAQADLAELLGRADAALVTPMWDEPYGLVVAEALACGTPCAASGAGHYRRSSPPRAASWGLPGMPPRWHGFCPGPWRSAGTRRGSAR